MRWCSKRTEMVFLTCLKFASPAWGKLWFLAKEATESLLVTDSPSEEGKAMYELPTRPLQFGPAQLLMLCEKLNPQAGAESEIEWGCQPASITRREEHEIPEHFQDSRTARLAGGDGENGQAGRGRLKSGVPVGDRGLFAECAGGARSADRGKNGRNGRAVHRVEGSCRRLRSAAGEFQSGSHRTHEAISSSGRRW